MPCQYRSVLAGLAVAMSLIAGTVQVVRADTSKLDFWSVQRKGANMMNAVETEAQFAAAQNAHIQFVRLAVDKWPTAGGDFLIGDADHYQGLNQADLARLRAVLAMAEKHQIKIVLTMLSLPGDRWRQLNGGKDDPRLWQDKAYWQQAADFWRDLAAALKDEPAIVAYNLINEPHPEKLGDFDEDGTRDFAGWYRRYRGSSRDLNDFYATIVSAIRSVDRATPIMLDAGLYAAPDAIGYLQPLGDPAVLYAFHMYEPYAFTSPGNKGKYHYPGEVPFAGKSGAWDAGRLNTYLAAVESWQQAHRLAANRVIGAEFGCYRRNAGCRDYLADVIAAFNQHHWHWAFYAFREDGWDGMDYETGAGPLPWSYWQAQEAGKAVEPPRKDNPLWEVIERELQ